MSKLEPCGDVGRNYRSEFEQIPPVRLVRWTSDGGRKRQEFCVATRVLARETHYPQQKQKAIFAWYLAGLVSGLQAVWRMAERSSNSSQASYLFLSGHAKSVFKSEGQVPRSLKKPLLAISLTNLQVRWLSSKRDALPSR